MQNLPATWVRRLNTSLSIAKKISYGYSLAIGIAVLGTISGLVIGDYYKVKAEKQLEITDAQQHLLSDLETAVLTVRLHPQRLINIIEDSIWFEYETAKFSGDVTKIKAQLAEIEAFINKHPREVAVDAKHFNKVLKAYEETTDSYNQLVKSIWQQIDSSKLKPEEIQASQQLVLVSIKGEEAIKLSVKFERLSESLNRIIAAAQTQHRLANASLRSAEALRLQIVVVSMLLSVGVATALALYTSRAIARPLEAVTKLAHRVTQESNFDLRANVTTEDEVGSLSTSLNQLVQWVGEYTQELELARQLLEQRVEERTQELTVALSNLKQTQAQLIQTEKMSSLGQMVAGVAHEINNPMNFIYGNINHVINYSQDLLALIKLYQQRYPSTDSEIQDQLEAIDIDFLIEDLPKTLCSMKMGTDRVRQIVLSLRNFSRLDEAEMKSVDIHEGIDNTLLILNHRLKQRVEVIKKYGDLPLIACYPAQLNQVFMNILANAIDALCSENIQPNKQIVIQTQKVDSNHILVGIWDNGPGIPPEIRDKLFDPFFTTKPVGQGTGLGLAICYQIIAKHRGKIEVISGPGQGTEFALSLPINTKGVDSLF